MQAQPSIELTLLENSHAFLQEAVVKAVAATTEVREWQFAILHIVQALELSLKAALKNVHPAFVFENVDDQRKTVAPLVALRRLEKLGVMVVSEKDVRTITHAIEMRNKVTHADFRLTPEYARGKFCELFAFVSEFHHRHLGTKVSEVIAADQFDQIVRIRRVLDELVARARARIEAEGIDAKLVWACPSCDEDTFVIDERNMCFACQHEEEVVECPQCSNLAFESEMESFVDDLDSDYSEGQVDIVNAFGYTTYDACPGCLPEIRQDIEDKRQEEEFERLEHEYKIRARRVR